VNRAQQSAVVACLIGLGMLYVAVLQAGLIPSTGIAASGLVLLGLGIVSGHSGTVVTGLGALVFGTALGLGTDGAPTSVLVAIGIAGPVVLVLTDASWWLRRDAEVDPEVGQRLAGSLVPGLVVGALIGMALLRATADATGPVWLVPIAVAVLAGAIAAAGETVRRRRPRLGPGPGPARH